MKKSKVVQKPTCVIYARVSTVEQKEEGYSLDAQLALLKDYARSKGFVVLGEYTDADSGSRTGRSVFGQMLELLREAGPSCAIVCEKTDRLYRNFSDMVKVDELGVELHFVKENIVVGPNSRSSDKFMHSIKVCLAKHFSDNLREEVRKGMTEKAKQGIYPSMAPIGYCNVQRGNKRVIEPDPHFAPLVRQVFEAYASGEVALEGATSLAKNIGLSTRSGHTMARSAIARMLVNPLYVGIVHWGGVDYQGVHEPIVPQELFHAVQRMMKGRTTNAGFGGTHEFPYRGLMSCAYCGCAITSEIKKGTYVYYRCTGMRDRHCPGMKAVREEALTDQFASLLEGLVLSPVHLEQLKQALKESLSEESAVRRAHTQRIAQGIDRLKIKLERAYLDRLNDRVSDEVYESVRQKLESELAGLDVQRQALDSAVTNYYDLGLRLLELAQTAHFRFNAAEPDTKRKILIELLATADYCDRQVQVSLKSPFNVLLERNVQRLNSGTQTAASENWHPGQESNLRPTA